MAQTDILIVGGGPAGMVAAATSKQYYPDKKITVVKKGEKSLVPCGIPYVFGTMLDSPEDDMIPCGARAEKMGVELMHDEIVEVDFDAKEAIGSDGIRYGYEKLILATGSVPKTPPIENVDAEGVFYVPKDPDYILRMYEKVQAMETIAVIGTGFIGVEIAGELAHRGKEVHLVGSRLLKHAFDPELSDYMEEKMLHDRVRFHKDQRTTKILVDNEGKVTGVEFKSGDRIEVDGVILATGYRPNTEMARRSGLSMRQYDTIYVDEYMRTTKEDVFAIGDCAEKRHFLTKRTVPIMLASTATAEARVAAANLYKINLVKSFSGTIDIFSTVIGDTCFASAGITEEDAAKQNINTVSSSVIVDGKHPAKLPNNRQQAVRLVAMAHSGIVIGAQVIGGTDMGEMINILGVIIEKRMSVYDLLNLQVATHPLLTSGPTSYPIVQAAQNLVVQHIRS
ncbi:FAD-dependent oxidoreductase [Nitratifractor sp.]|uniref:FAD-dependent oxidoreductase n=1 Tax=Nitratifractor sp. TaxID=2268144 RepID=UPI0025F1085F|nr:FAD-dependent oxidoreductase [Nitratifractor sp.]